MSRNLWFLLLILSVLLLPATGIVRADDAPEAEGDSGATEAEAPTETTVKTEADAKKEEGAKPATDAKTEADAKKKEGPKVISGMSILGNQEAPKSLVIVPWKSSEIGASLGISTMLDDSRQPIDKEVFMRALNYYQIRSGKKP